MASSSDASPYIASLPNLRDVGGCRTRAGERVRSGLLYRSTELSRLEGADEASFTWLGIRSIYDLRTREEREMAPDRVPPGAELVVLDVLAASTDAGPAELMELFSDPRAANAALGAGRSARMFEGKYREFVSLESARHGFGRLFRDLSSEAHRPALIHCTTGKDRTGWAVAALLLLLGVPDEEVMRDFLRSNELLGPTTQPFLDAFVARGGDAAVLEPLMEVRPAYLEAALDEVHRSFGTIERYFAEGLDVDAPIQASLRSAFLAVD